MKAFIPYLNALDSAAPLSSAVHEQALRQKHPLPAAPMLLEPYEAERSGRIGTGRYQTRGFRLAPR